MAYEIVGAGLASLKSIRKAGNREETVTSRRKPQAHRPKLFIYRQEEKIKSKWQVSEQRRNSMDAGRAVTYRWKRLAHVRVGTLSLFFPPALSHLTLF